MTLSSWREIERSGPDLDRGALQVTKNTRHGEQEWRPSKLRVAGSSPAAPTRSLFVSAPRFAFAGGTPSPDPQPDGNSGQELDRASFSRPFLFDSPGDIAQRRVATFAAASARGYAAPEEHFGRTAP